MFWSMDNYCVLDEVEDQVYIIGHLMIHILNLAKIVS